MAFIQSNLAEFSLLSQTLLNDNSLPVSQCTVKSSRLKSVIITVSTFPSFTRVMG